MIFTRNLEIKDIKLPPLLKSTKTSKSTYYFELNKVNAALEKNSDLLPGLKIFFHENKGRNGVVRIHQEFSRLVHVVNHIRVHKLFI